MFRIGKLADYGLLLINRLAKQDALVTTEELSRATQVPMATVRKLLKLLVDAGLVLSVRGTKGGYQLQRPAQQISIAQVIEAIDGPLAITECNQDDSHCDLQRSCELKENWGVINQLVMQFLGSISVLDMNTTLDQLTEVRPEPLQLDALR